MKTASVLFGLITAACGSTQPEASYPLCDPQGAPACGNIGQVGRTRETTVIDEGTVIDKATALPIAATSVAESAVIRIVPVVNVLLGASREREVPQARDAFTSSIVERRTLQLRPQPASRSRPGAVRSADARPLLAPTASPPKPPAADRRLHISARESSATAPTAAQPFARPLANNREEIVCGNVMGKGSSRRVCRNRVGEIVSSVSMKDSGGSEFDTVLDSDLIEE